MKDAESPSPLNCPLHKSILRFFHAHAFFSALHPLQSLPPAILTSYAVVEHADTIKGFKGQRMSWCDKSWLDYLLKGARENVWAAPQVDELEGFVELLEKRTSRLTKGSKKYRDCLNQLGEQQLAFAECVQEFAGGTDEESLLLGAPRPAVKRRFPYPDFFLASSEFSLVD